MKLNVKKSHAKGFTLIELIMVMVILGILSAFALPRMSDFSGRSALNATEAARSAVITAMNLAHIEGQTLGAKVSVASEDVDLQYAENVPFVYGYPAGSALATWVNLEGFTLTGATIALDADADCYFDYTDAADATTPPVVSAVNAACGT